MNLRDSKFGHISALRPAIKRARPVNADLPAGADELASLLGGRAVRNHYGEHLLMRNWFAEPEQCALPNGALDLLLPVPRPVAARDEEIGPRRRGRSLDRPAPAPPAPNRELAADPEKWLFLDTETTGLAGGTGTYAFLVGLAWWEAGGLQIEQLFLRDFTEEHSLLVALAERLAERPVLVTFNGKTFDWPLLDTRYRMTRCIPTPPLAAHLDLLHPSRQLWRLRWGSVRLCELERNVLATCGPRLAWSRDGDVRGDMIPQIYFDYLRGARPEALLDVLRHNQMDLRGLAALAGRVIALLNDPQGAEGDGYELFGVSRIVKQRAPREPARARELFASAVTAGLPADLDRRARREMAVLARREKDDWRAATIWESLVGQASPPVRPLESCETNTNGRTDPEVCPTITLEAYEQLAIHAERRLRDPRRALQLANAGMAEVRRLQRGALAPAAAIARIRYRLYERIARLEQKTTATLV